MKAHTNLDFQLKSYYCLTVALQEFSKLYNLVVNRFWSNTVKH